MIPPYPKEESCFWPYDKREGEFIDFIIEETADGEMISFSCNPEKLANNFGANPQAPNYLTPVFFKREVLQKYYNSPERYVVGDSMLSCGGYWSLAIDNNHEKIVIAYLGDLGRDLPEKERAYWKSFNIPPEGKLSETKIRRDFMAEFCDPEGKDLLFKQRYEQVNKEWKRVYGWQLFVPLQKDDIHFYKNMRIPLNGSRSEFDSQVSSLAKICIDALNTKMIRKTLVGEIDKDAKSISLLKQLLTEQNFSDFKDGVEMMKLVQGLRSSGVAHLKGSNYEKIIKKNDFENKDLVLLFSDFLSELVSFMEVLLKKLETIEKDK